MQLTLNGHHVEITQALNDYVEEKFTRLKRHADSINKVHVILSVEKHLHKAEATIRINGAEIFANSESEDMYAAIDALLDKLDRQLLKHKEKSITRKQGAR